MIVLGFICAAMAFVFRRVLQQIAVQLLDMVFGQRDVCPMREDGFHDFGVAGDFLFVARCKFLRLETCEQTLDLLVAQLRALDPGRGSDTLDGCDQA